MAVQLSPQKILPPLLLHYAEILYLYCGLYLEWLLELWFSQEGQSSRLPWPKFVSPPPVSSICPVTPHCVLFNDKLQALRNKERETVAVCYPKDNSEGGKTNLHGDHNLLSEHTSRWLLVAKGNHTPACPGSSLCDEAQMSDCACVCVCESCLKRIHTIPHVRHATDMPRFKITAE